MRKFLSFITLASSFFSVITIFIFEAYVLLLELTKKVTMMEPLINLIIQGVSFVFPGIVLMNVICIVIGIIKKWDNVNREGIIGTVCSLILILAIYVGCNFMS